LSNKEKLLASAQKNLEKGQYIKAIKDFEEVVALEPKVAGHRQKLADAMVRAQMPAGAVPHYEFVATSLSEAGFYLKAIAIYKQIQKIEPERFDIFLRLAELNEKQGLAGNASSEYRNLAALYEKKGMITEAIGILQKVADMEPGNILHKVRIAECYAKGGLKEKGREEFERLAAELEAHKSFDQLLKVYEYFVKLFPGVRSAQAGFARTLVLRGDAEKGMQLLKGLIKQSPDDVDVLNALASGYQALGDFENEHLTLQHLLKKRPDDLNDRERLIRSFLAGGDFPRGMEELQKWGGELLSSGRKDAVHAFCRHLQQELPGDDERMLQLFGTLGLAPVTAAAAGTAPTATATATGHEGDFDLDLALGGSVAETSAVSAEENIALPSGGAVESSADVKVLDATSALPPEGGGAGAPAPPPAPTPAAPVSFGAEEAPLDFLEGFGTMSGAAAEPVSAKPAAVVTAPKISPPAPPVVAPPEVTATEVPVALAEMEFELDLGGVEVSESLTIPEPDVAPLAAAPAEPTPDHLDAATEISFPDDFTLDLSAAEVAAGTPDTIADTVVLSGGEIDFSAPFEIDLSSPEEATAPQTPEFALAPGDAAAEIEAVEELEELEELEQLEELEELEHLEELEELEEVEPLTLDVSAPEAFSAAGAEDSAESLETDIDISGYSLDGLDEIALDSGNDGGPQFPEPADNSVFAVDLEAVAVKTAGAGEIAAATDGASEAELEISALLDDGGEDLGEFDLAAVAVDDSAVTREISELPRPDEPSPAPLGTIAEMTAEVAEVGFYLNQGLYAEAEQICRRLLHVDPNFAPALEKLAEVENRRRHAAPVEAPAGEDFLDLAAEILDDGALRATENLPGVDDLDRFRFDGVFSEFKKGIESQIDSEDTESHYNLGIAYKEMGLLDDAIAEFAKAMVNPARRVDCLTLQGICLAEKGAFAQAETLFASGIDNRDLSEMERISLHYEMGLLYESWQRPADALSSFSTVAASDTVFRDVASKIKELQSRLEASGESPAGETKPAKNRVSYV